MTRNTALDGLRGVAALVVVVFHFLACFAPAIVPAYSTHVPMWVDTPLGLLIHGSFAVSIFFVLSGFVLAAASSKSKSKLTSTIAWRWVRLAVPATASILFSWVLLSVIPDAARLLDPYIPSPWHQYVFQGSIPTVMEAATHGLFWIFVDTPGPASFNNVLWTMKFEFAGSIAVYVFYRAVRRKRLTALAVIAIALVVLRMPMPFLAFAGGAAIFELMTRRTVLPKWSPPTLLVLGLMLAFPADGFVWRWRGGSLPPILQLGNGASMMAPLAACLIVLAIVNSAAIARPLRSAPAVFLGKVSFPLYLLHVPLIYTVVALGVTHYGLFSPTSLALVFVVFLSITFALAWCFEALIDAPLVNAIARQKRARGGGVSGL